MSPVRPRLAVGTTKVTNKIIGEQHFCSKIKKKVGKRKKIQPKVVFCIPCFTHSRGYGYTNIMGVHLACVISPWRVLSMDTSAAVLAIMTVLVVTVS